MITARTEDYLEKMFLLESAGLNITVTNLARCLNVSKGTVAAAVQKMASAGVLTHERYGALYFTEKGRLRGLSSWSRHVGLRDFFHEFWGMDRFRSSEMACAVAHHLDTMTDQRLYAMLEFFRRARANNEPWVYELCNAMDKPVLLPNPLSTFENGQKGSVVRLSAGEALRKRLQDMGFATGVLVTCVDVSRTGSLQITLKGKEMLLPRNEAATVWLRTVQGRRPLAKSKSLDYVCEKGA
jgi:Mn-dependent DtxR family transcriptional regulator/Fe2+ transport system protein FeoA